MLILRPWVCRKYLPRQSKMSIYAAMYFIPLLVVAHALIGGLICNIMIVYRKSIYLIWFYILDYAFPYLVVILSVISCAAHFAVKLEQTIWSLIITTIVEPRNIIILVGHWCLHAYGIISITQLTDPILHSMLILLVPLPALFYIFTVNFTDPKCHF